MAKKIADIPSQTGNFQLEIHDAREYFVGDGKLSYQSHPNDTYGKLFGMLFKDEFCKRGFLFSIQYLSPSYIKLMYEWHTTDDKMFNALDTIALNSDRIQ